LARFACYRNSVDYLCYIKTGEWKDTLNTCLLQLQQLQQ
jgi:hypothetical protein